MVMTKPEACKVLEVDSVATAEEIRASYKRLALKWHPDKHSNSQEATLKFQEISEAYKRLTSNDDDDNIRISMTDMFDLFRHIFFTNGRYYASTHNHIFFSDDDEDDDDDYYMMSSDSSVDEALTFCPKPRSKYCDFHGGKSSSNKNNKMNSFNSGLSEAEAMRNAEELIKEEEKMKKKAEKRRAKKKRNQAKRKQRDKKQKQGSDNGVNNETSEEEEEEEKVAREKQNENRKPGSEQKQETSSSTRKNTTAEKSEDSGSEHIPEDTSWDTSSAFFANAARRGPVNANSEATPSSTPEAANNVSQQASVKRNENNSQTKKLDRRKVEDDEEHDPIVIQSRQVAVRGNSLANEGKYEEAIKYFTQAISLHDSDYRFFGNRSYCYDRLGQYSKALQDAEVTISLAPVWPKGHFRKGRALAGLKRYSDAESAFTQVLKLDKHCDDARLELNRVRVQQLKDMGFPQRQCENAVRLHGTVHAALDALLSGKVNDTPARPENTYIAHNPPEEKEETETRSKHDLLASLWVGNINANEVTERQLTQLFSKCGPLKLIRILPASFCAFVNYENKEAAAKALQYLQGYPIGGQNLRIRYPNSDKYPKSLDKVSGPVNGDECYFWRTTGCAYGDKCRYSHVPAHRGIDRDKVEQKFGKINPMNKGR